MNLVATVLTAYGIETKFQECTPVNGAAVATVLTAYGIETIRNKEFASLSFLLQQCLPLTVLKLK